MVKKKTTIKKSTTKKNTPKKKNSETDSHFFLKSVVFLILGSQWVYIETSSDVQIPIPVGLILGLVLATHEHFQIDRKIEYTILLISAFIAFWLPIGLVIQL
jgi:hypothetical protein